jgi:2'-5' RNA ligase
MKRLFIAIEIPKEIKEKISKELITPLGNVKKVNEENLHITLCFLGDTYEQKEKLIIEALNKIEYKKFDVLVGRVGQFNERVIFVSAESIELYSLAERISAALCTDNEFNGHITVARASEGTMFEKEFSLIKNKRINSTIKVKKFVLFESKPSPTGSIYSKVAEFKAK